MNLTHEIAKLRDQDHAGRVFTVDELELLASLLRSALQALKRRNCQAALVVLEAVCGEEESEG